MRASVSPARCSLPPRPPPIQVLPSPALCHACTCERRRGRSLLGRAPAGHCGRLVPRPGHLVAFRRRARRGRPLGRGLSTHVPARLQHPPHPRPFKLVDLTRRVPRRVDRRLDRSVDRHPSPLTHLTPPPKKPPNQPNPPTKPTDPPTDTHPLPSHLFSLLTVSRLSSNHHPKIISPNAPRFCGSHGPTQRPVLPRVAK